MADITRAREAQITPAQLAVFMVVQVISVIQSLLPAFIGMGKIDPIWFIIAFGINNGAYFLIMVLRGKFQVKPELMGIVISAIENIGMSAFDKSMDKEQLVKSIVRSIVWLIQELDILYAEDKELIDEQFKTYIKDKSREILYGIPAPAPPPKPYLEEAAPGETIEPNEVMLNSLKQLEAGITEKHPEIKAEIERLEEKLKSQE